MDGWTSRRIALVASTWSPYQQMHPGNLAWHGTGCDGAPPADLTMEGDSWFAEVRVIAADQKAISMVLATEFTADPVVRWLVPKAATFRCFEPLPVTWMPLPVARILGSSQKRV